MRIRAKRCAFVGAIAAVGVALSAGCSLSIPGRYVAPEEVTLNRAMEDISCALKTFENENSKLKLNTNTIVDQIEITLNLKASATGVSGLAVNTAPAVDPSIMASLGVNYSDTTTLVGERGNTLKIVMKNLHTASLNPAGLKAASADTRTYGPGPLYRMPVANPCDPTSFDRPQSSTDIVVDVP